ncbi:TolC family protein [Pendulispora brunnea]|uniref:TolC family protein n=1 Tax=Pendulispora brunnea TaxID=2905690 RepID=A0ABZ2KMA6_9BACT
MTQARSAHAGPFDLEDDDDKKKQEKQDQKIEAAPAKDPLVLTKHKAYTLAECLSLTERNHPNLWVGRARLAAFHAQLDEARWAPFFQWNTTATLGVIPEIKGTPFYTAAPANLLSTKFTDGLNPFLQFTINGYVPLFHFGKIDWARRAGEAQVRAGEWDLEKFRQEVRRDVRKAYYVIMGARDGRYLLNEVRSKLEKAIENVQGKLDRGEAGVEETDRIRLEVYRDQLLARAGTPDMLETNGIAALRFMTGVQTNFDIPDEPLARPDVNVAPVVSYLSAARLFRAEVGSARAGIAQRNANLELMRARLFPDIGIDLRASYSTAPSVITQNNAWVVDYFNRFTYNGSLTARWNLDIMPAQARVNGAESQLEEARAFERLTLGNIGVEVESAYAAMLETRKREEMWARAEKKAKGWIASVQDAIDLGTKEEGAIMEPLRSFVDSRLNHIQALVEYYITLSELARVSGWDAAAPQK